MKNTFFFNLKIYLKSKTIIVNQKLKKISIIPETYSKYPNIPYKNNIFMIGSRIGPELKQRPAGPEKTQ